MGVLTGMILAAGYGLFCTLTAGHANLDSASGVFLGNFIFRFGILLGGLLGLAIARRYEGAAAKLAGGCAGFFVAIALARIFDVQSVNSFRFLLLCSIVAGVLVGRSSRSSAKLTAPGKGSLAVMALLLLAHNSFAQGNYSAFSLTPQQMVEGVDAGTVQQLIAANNTVQRSPNDVNALVTRAVISLKIAGKSRYSFQWVHFAAKDLEKAIQLDPNNFYARHNYATACYQAGDFSDAQPAMHLAVYQFTKAIQLKPDSARSYMGRGWAYLMMDDQAHAQADFQKTLELDPSLRVEMLRQANAITQRRGQKEGVLQTLRAMGSYTVDPTARTAGACAAKKGYWTNGECRFTDLGLHQGFAPPSSPGTGTYSSRGGGMVVK